MHETLNTVKKSKIKNNVRTKFHFLLSQVSSEPDRCLEIRLVKRPCCYCVGRVVSGGNPRSLARRGRLSRLLQFKHNGGYQYRFQNSNNESNTISCKKKQKRIKPKKPLIIKKELEQEKNVDRKIRDSKEGAGVKIKGIKPEERLKRPDSE